MEAADVDVVNYSVRIIEVKAIVKVIGIRGEDGQNSNDGKEPEQF